MILRDFHEFQLFSTNFRVFNVVNAAFGHLKAPLDPKRQLFVHCFNFFSAFFQFFWPLARPNIAEKGAAIVERVWEGFGTGLGIR